MASGYAPATAIPTPTPTPTPISKDKEKAQAPAAYGDLLIDVDKQVLADWMALRKTKKAPITRTAVEGLIAEARKAGMTTEDAMRTSCANGWQGFKADWVVKPLKPQASGETAYQRSMREKFEEASGRTPARAHRGVIDITPHHLEIAQ